MEHPARAMNRTYVLVETEHDEGCVQVLDTSTRTERDVTTGINALSDAGLPRQ